jgi:hypothetical protein
MNWSKIDVARKAYFESELNCLFDVSSGSHERIIQNLFRIINKSSSTKTQISIIAVLCQIVKYYAWGAFGFLLRIYQSVILFFKGSNFKPAIILITSPSKIDRYSHIKDFIFDNFKVLHYNFINQNNYQKIKFINSNYKFLFPIIPGISAISKTIKYFFIHRRKLIGHLINAYKYDFSINATDIDRFIIKNLIYNESEKKHAKTITRNANNAIFIFDQDAGGKELMIVDKLNQKNFITVMIQHGIITDPRLYIPVTKYMFCCSEREKKLLTSCNVSDKRLMTLGTAFQNIVQNSNIKKEKKYNTKLLVLASSGKNFTDKYIDIIKTSKVIKNIENKALRLRPGDTPIIKQKWKESLPDFKIRQNISNITEIVNADIIITFSYDALIKCLSLKKKVIVGLPQIDFDSNYVFLSEINFLRTVKNSDELDGKLIELFKLSQKEYNAELNQSILNYNFGETDIYKIRDNFNHNIKVLKNLK